MSAITVANVPFDIDDIKKKYSYLDSDNVYLRLFLAERVITHQGSCVCKVKSAYPAKVKVCPFCRWLAHCQLSSPTINAKSLGGVEENSTEIIEDVG